MDLEAIAPLRAGGAYSNLRLAAVNERVRGGISTVPTGQFGTGRSGPVGVNGETFRGGRMIAGNLPVVPTRAALSVTNRPAAASTLPRGGAAAALLLEVAAAPAPQSFDRQVTQMRQSMQRNGAGAEPVILEWAKPDFVSRQAHTRISHSSRQRPFGCAAG